MREAFCQGYAIKEAIEAVIRLKTRPIRCYVRGLRGFLGCSEARKSLTIFRQSSDYKQQVGFEP